MITHINIPGYGVQVSKGKPRRQWLVTNGKYNSTCGFAEKTFSREVETVIILQGGEVADSENV